MKLLIRFWIVILLAILCSILLGLNFRIFDKFCIELTSCQQISSKYLVPGMNEDENDRRNFKYLIGQYINSETQQNSTEPEKRAQYMRGMCTLLSNLGQVPIDLERHGRDNMYVNDQYKFIFCTMPKLACTNWKRVFVALSEDYPDKHKVLYEIPGPYIHGVFNKYCKTLENYSLEEIQYRLKTYRKLIFVRDPFERILSSYKDKMLRTDHGFQIVEDRIKQLKRKHGFQQPDPVTFVEFIEYLTDSDTFESSFEVHWAKYNHLCQPCILKYDFIGKFESMDEDIDLAFKFTGINNTLKFPQRNMFYKNTKTVDIVNQYYKDIPNFYLRKVWNHLKSDYFLFSYSIPEILLAKQVLNRTENDAELYYQDTHGN